MLHSIQERYGEKLRASDGEIGHVRDFYFDDKNWTVRYLVADTGHWLTGRLVLISPHAFGHLHPEGKVLLVNLTRKQIEDSPSIDEHKPVSRQHEEEYHRHYGYLTTPNQCRCGVWLVTRWWFLRHRQGIQSNKELIHIFEVRAL